MSNKIRVGLFGVGHLGKVHLKLLKELSTERNDFEIAGINDLNKENLNTIAEEFDINGFESSDDLIEKIDAGVIVASTSAHYELAKKMLNNDIHAFIEKPVTDTIIEANELLEIFNKKNLIVQIGHIERFNPALLAIEKYNLTPLFIESHRLSQFNPRGTDVSVIKDLMIHDIDIILNLVKSKVKNISANGVAIITDKIDIANARIEFENGCVANVTASRISQKKMRKMRIFQQNAYISVDFAENTSEVFRLSKEASKEGFSMPVGQIEKNGENLNVYYDKPNHPEINPLKFELSSFIDSIKNNSEPKVTLEDGMEALRVAEMIVKQIEETQKFKI
ncbi:MAG: Gfo/Idh/MocA family oxidoreductase [Ignavibacteria bacterium]|nr:Gfo/Idh/MocA family oxidoreductase [Ignavibacteria bacterium]